MEALPTHFRSRERGKRGFAESYTGRCTVNLSAERANMLVLLLGWALRHNIDAPLKQVLGICSSVPRLALRTDFSAYDHS